MISISNPLLAEYFGVGTPNFSGTEVTEGSALALSAVYRAVSLISGQLGMLPLRSLRDAGNGTREPQPSFLDEPGGLDGPTSFEWKQTVLMHLLLYGNAFLAHVYTTAGTLAALAPLHPLAVDVRWATRAELDEQSWPGGKIFTATLLDDETRTFSAADLTHVPSLSSDGLKGMSVIAQARNGFGTAIAGDRAAAKMFRSGALIAGMVTPEEDVEEEEAKKIKRNLDKKLTGWENAGEIAVINRKLKFTPWTLSAVDAQFLQSRQFQIEEIARWFGVPPFMLMQAEKQTSWGTGIESQQRGLSREVLGSWATLLEQRLARLLPVGRFCEFDFSALERPTPEQEVALLAQKVDAGLLTINEARTTLNLPSLDGGDLPRYGGQPLTSVISTPPPEVIP